MPRLTPEGITAVTWSIEGEEGEHAEVTVTKTGAVRTGRSRRGHGGGLPVLRAGVRKLPDPPAFFTELVRLLDSAGFVGASARSPQIGMWNELTVEWQGSSKTCR